MATGPATDRSLQRFCDQVALELEFEELLGDDHYAATDPTSHFVACLELNDQVQFENLAL